MMVKHYDGIGPFSFGTSGTSLLFFSYRLLLVVRQTHVKTITLSCCSTGRMQGMEKTGDVNCNKFYVGASFRNCFPLIVSPFRSDSWQLVQSECLPSSVNNVGCSPFQFHESTVYSPVNSSTWTRVTVLLPDHVSSGYLSI